MYSRMPKEKWRLREASLKLGSMSQKRSKALARIIHWQTRTRRFLLRLMSRDKSSEKGITQWKMKSRVMMMPQWPRMRSRYQLISSGRLPDQMIEELPEGEIDVEHHEGEGELAQVVLLGGAQDGGEGLVAGQARWPR